MFVVLMPRWSTQCGARLTAVTTLCDLRRCIDTETSSWGYRNGGTAWEVECTAVTIRFLISPANADQAQPLFAFWQSTTSTGKLAGAACGIMTQADRACAPWHGAWLCLFLRGGVHTGGPKFYLLWGRSHGPIGLMLFCWHGLASAHPASACWALFQNSSVATPPVRRSLCFNMIPAAPKKN